MAIRVTCSCGEQLKAKDEAAGRRIRCPACQSVLHVPPVREPPQPEIDPQPIEPVTRPKRKMAWLPFVAVGVVALLIIPFTFPRRPKASRAPENAVSTQEKPDTAASPESPIDGRLKALLAKADLAYADDEARIVRLVELMISEVKKAGQTLTPEEALEGSLRWPMPGYFSRQKQSEFKEFFTLYLATRTSQKLSHAQTIRQNHILARAVDFRSEETTEAEFEAAFTNASPGCQLAIAEARRPIPENDPVAAYYGDVNREVAAAYGMAEQETAPAVALAVVELANIDENTAPDEILFAARGWIELAAEGAPKFDAFLKLYMALRLKKTSHAMACEILCGERPDDALPESVTP